MEKIKIGHIGTLHDHSFMTMDSLLRLSDAFEVVGFVPESEERYNEVRESRVYKGLRAMSLEELFDLDIDAVVVEGFEKDLIPVAQKCADRGLHMHIDKPAGESLSEFKRLLECAERKRLVVQMGYMYRYNPSVRAAVAAVREGQLGKIYSVEAHMSCLHPADKRRWLGQFRGGMMFFLGCHLIDLIVQLQGIPDEVIPMNMPTGIDDIDAEDLGMAVLKYKNGLSFAKACACEVNGFARRQLVICGGRGTIEIKPLERFDAEPQNTRLLSEMNMTLSDEARDWSDHSRRIEIPPYDRYDTMMRDFAEYIREAKENPYTYEYEYALHKVILQACGYDVG